MFKIIRLLALLMVPVIAFSQKSDHTVYKNIVSDYLKEKKTEWKLTDRDVTEWKVSSCYTNNKWGITYFYLQQQVNNINIFNAISSITIKNGKVNSFTRGIHPDAAGHINSARPSFGHEKAIEFAAKHLEISDYSKPVFLSEDRALNRFYYSSDLSSEKIRIDLVYQPVNNTLHLAYDVNIRTTDRKHWWNMRIDANTGKLLSKNDWTVSCDFEPHPSNGTNHNHSHSISPQTSGSASAHSTALPSYRVYPLPIEAPSFGLSALIPDPSDPVASPFGWHDVDGNAGAEFNITRGNNVYAYDDIANIDAPGTSPNGTATLTFDFQTNFNLAPSGYLDASTTNLFYVNNMMHDILAHYGFDELSGNFQQSNYSGQGLGTDHVIAECQDGGGTNNANFSTPDDGQNGWMQMYLWAGNSSATFLVNSPSGIAGSYNCAAAGFGPAVTVPITADAVLINDGNGVVTDACDPIVNGSAISGKIAIIDRGTCNFADKVLAAQNEGAIAAIVINNTGGAPFAMGGNANSGLVTIPSVMISQTDGNLIKNALNTASVNITLNAATGSALGIDGSLDNGIVIHEYGHGVSNRLTGGPMNSNCLSNDQQGGEGWSDYFALMFTMKAGDVGTAGRGVGTYALAEPSTGQGIRRFPYSTDMGINPLTYGDIQQSPEVHDIGEIWCVTLWDMTWNLIDLYGFDGDWINGVDTAGNHVALNLVMEGLKIQDCNPNFLESRDAILEADDNLYGGIHKCMIWETFARRGMGFSATSANENAPIEAFDIPTLCMTPIAAPVADFNAVDTTSCVGIIQFTDLSTSIPQSWSWDFGDGNTSALQNPTHTYTAPGIYTVTLTVTNTIGTDSFVRTGYISITSPSMPAVTGDTLICNGFSTVLTASVAPGNVCEWRDVNDVLLFSGTSFTTPVLTSTTSYKVIQFSPTTVQNVGPTGTNIGSGGYHATTFEGSLFFTAQVPVRIKSVLVDADGAANRQINLYQAGNLVQSMNIMIPDGQSRVTLNMDVLTPGNYEISVTAGSGLFRNQDGANYPYTIPGLVSITGSNSTSNPAIYYYYLYDWEVQELPCTSAPLTVTVTVDNQLSSFTFADNGLTVTFNSTGVGAVSWLWDFGNGNTSTLPNPVINFNAPGNYTVSLTTTDANGCQSATAHILTLTSVGIESVDAQHVKINYEAGSIHVRFDIPADNARIRIFDPIGKMIVNEIFNGTEFTIPTATIAAELLMIDVTENGKIYSR